MKLFIISNRLPVKAVCREEGYGFTPSEGGFATGLDSLHTRCEKHWIGWPGLCIERPEARQQVHEELERMIFHSVFLSPAQIENYYEGYSNSTIWLLYHFFRLYALPQGVPRRLPRGQPPLLRGGAASDRSRRHRLGAGLSAQFVPGMLREIMPSACIGYSHRIPFPSYELFRILPERTERLCGVLRADPVAFRTY